MAAKTKEADAALHNFWDDNARFANLFNVFCFDGKPVVLPEDLYPVDTQLLATIPGLKKLVAALRRVDVIRLWQTASTKQILVMENQTFVDYAMPVRVEVIKGASYGDQRSALQRIHENNKDLAPGSEFLSGFTKDDKIMPVTVLVVYYEEEAWDAPQTLEETFGPHHPMRDAFIEARKIEDERLADMIDPVRILFEVLRMRSNRPRTDFARELTAYFAEQEAGESVIDTLVSLLGTDVRRLYRKGRNIKKGGKNLQLALDNLELEFAKKGYPELNKQLDATEKQLDATEKQRDAAEKQRDAAEKQLDATEKQRDAAEKQRDAAEKQRDAAEKRSIDLEKRSADLARSFAEYMYQQQAAQGVPLDAIVANIAQATRSEVEVVEQWVEEFAGAQN